MRRIRWAMGASLTVLAAGSGAAAQADALRELRDQNAAQHSAEIARQDLLAVQREIVARQDQASTGLMLRELNTALATPPGTNGLTLTPPIPLPESGSDSITGQMDRMERLTQDALARSNARVRAVRPASDR